MSPVRPLSKLIFPWGIPEINCTDQSSISQYKKTNILSNINILLEVRKRLPGCYIKPICGCELNDHNKHQNH